MMFKNDNCPKWTIFTYSFTIFGTHQSIADILGVPKMTISDVISKYEKGHLSNFAKDFKPFIYNIWNTQPRSKT